MKKPEQYLIIMPFHAKIIDGCDYVTQTMTIVGKTNEIIGVALGDPYSWKDIIHILRGRLPVTEKQFNATIVHPFMFIPGQRFSLIKSLDYWLNACVIRLYCLMFKRNKHNILWIFEPRYAPIFLRIFTQFLSLYDCVDYFADRGKDWQEDENALIRLCDYMTVNSQTLYKLHKKRRSDIAIVPLGFSEQIFSWRTVHTTNAKNGTLTIGFIGGLSYRLDYPLLYKVVSALPKDKFIFVGPIQTGLRSDETNLKEQIQKLLSFKNVFWQGQIAKDGIPAAINKFDVCIIPYDMKYEFNRYCYPMKLMEYFALGKPVISTPIEEVKKFKEFVSIVSSKEDFIDAINHIRKTNLSVETQNKEQKIAKENSWEKKIQSITDYIS